MEMETETETAIKVSAGSVVLGDRVVQYVARRRYVHTVARVVEQPVGVVSIYFAEPHAGGFHWSLPVGEPVTVVEPRPENLGLTLGRDVMILDSYTRQDNHDTVWLANIGELWLVGHAYAAPHTPQLEYWTSAREARAQFDARKQYAEREENDNKAKWIGLEMERAALTVRLAEIDQALSDVADQAAAESAAASCGRAWVAEIALCPRCAMPASEHRV